MIKLVELLPPKTKADPVVFGFIRYGYLQHVVRGWRTSLYLRYGFIRDVRGHYIRWELRRTQKSCKFIRIRRMGSKRRQNNKEDKSSKAESKIEWSVIEITDSTQTEDWKSTASGIPEDQLIDQGSVLYKYQNAYELRSILLFMW